MGLPRLVYVGGLGIYKLYDAKYHMPLWSISNLSIAMLLVTKRYAML